MRLAVGATRMELLRLKRRLLVARRGHKLLKDKQEQLMRKILELIKEIKGARERIARELTEINEQFLFAETYRSMQEHEETLMRSARKVELELGVRSIVNINVPTINRLNLTGPIINYNFIQTSGELDIALVRLNKILPELLNLVISEKVLELMAEELERTRRRVNALEYVLIPSLEETIRYINMKLSEAERANLTRLMRIKEIIRGA
ncbi:MAG: V-type ATP synthase subunit D [candidate division WOR-3 bacterium]|nr:V-type ATP synthase subunit D [candidate division WOR-3 bacterium]